MISFGVGVVVVGKLVLVFVCEDGAGELFFLLAVEADQAVLLPHIPVPLVDLAGVQLELLRELVDGLLVPLGALLVVVAEGLVLSEVLPESVPLLLGLPSDIMSDNGLVEALVDFLLLENEVHLLVEVVALEELVNYHPVVEVEDLGLLGGGLFGGFVLPFLENLLDSAL